MPLTEELATRIAAAGNDPVPADVSATLVAGLCDCVGVMLAGWQEPASRIARRFAGLPDEVSAFEIEGPASKLGLAFGSAAHALDFDDVALAAHPSAVLVPTLLAKAFEIGASGEQLIRAYWIGYEVWAELWRREPDPLHSKGWHPTAVLGPLAAAAAAASLTRQPADVTRAALAIAASLAGGIAANFGSMTKPFQVGRAASSGLEAVELAELGLTASGDALEQDLGFLAAYSPHGRAQRDGGLSVEFGRSLSIQGLSLKLYPVCYALHRAIDGLMALRAREDWSLPRIAGVEVEIGATQARMLHHHRPQTPLDAKFSLEFAMAAAAIAGRVSSAELTGEFVRRPDVQAFFGKVSHTALEATDPLEPTHSPYDRVIVTLDDGRRLDSGKVEHAEGHFRRPAPAARLRQKFYQCAARELPPATIERLFEALLELPRLPDVRRLRALASGR